MKKFKLEVVVIFLIIFIFLAQGASAFHWVTGYVKNSTDGVSPDGSTAQIYCDAGYTLIDYIGNGTANQSNWYMFDIDSLSGCSEGSTIYTKVLPNNTFYSGPINTSVVNGSFQMPNMTFNQKPILNNLLINLSYAETDDWVNITSNGTDPNGDAIQIRCYKYRDFLPENKICESTYAVSNRSCVFKANSTNLPTTTDGLKAIYCTLNDLHEGIVYETNQSGEYKTKTFILDNTPPDINDIQMISDSPDDFYVNNSFNGTHIVVMFNSIAGAGANQEITITVEYSDLGPNKLVGNDTFGNGEQINDTDTLTPTIKYTIPEGAGQNSTLLTVYDKLNHTSTAKIIWINSTDITSQDNVPEPIYWYNTSEINITINVTSLWDIQNTTYCVDDYDSRITSSHYNEYCNPKTDPDGTETYSDPTAPELNITLTCPENTACQKVLRYYSTTTGGLDEDIIRTSNPINIITGSSVTNKIASFTQIYPTSTITDSINFNVTITNSIEANSNCTNETILNSEIANSLVQNSNIENSYLFYSTILESPTSNSSIALSNITNSTITNIDSTLYDINVTYISNSEIQDSTITNSRIYSSFIDPSIIIDSYISNTNITNSTVRYSRIEDSIICSGMDINSAVIGNNVMSSGKIIYEDKTYYGPYNISLICQNETLPFPIGEFTYSPEYPTSYENITMCHHANDVGYNITSAYYDPSDAFLGGGFPLYDNGNESNGDEKENDAIYCVKRSFEENSTETGNYTVEITEKDNLGNTNKINFTLRIDNQNPEATIRINNGDSKTTTSDVTLNLAYSDEFSGVDSCAYYNADPSIYPEDDSVCEAQNGYVTKLDCDPGYYQATTKVFHCCLPEEQFSSCSPTKEWKLTSGYGTRNVWYQVKDRAGNTQTTSDSILLEPNAPIITQPENNDFVENNITIIAYAPSETTIIRFYIVNSTDEILIKSDGNGSDGWNAELNTTNYEDGEYLLKINAYEDGEYAGTYNTTINIDNNIPNNPKYLAINGEKGIAYDNDGNVSFALTPSSSDDVEYYNIYKSDVPNINLTSGNIYKILNEKGMTIEWNDIFQDGTYYFTGTAVDFSGKESQASDEITLHVDTETPIGELTAEPTTVSNEDTIIFKYYGYETGLSVVIPFSSILSLDSTATSQVNFSDNGEGVDLVANDSIYTGSYTIGKFNARRDGDHIVTATVNDSFGNLFYPKVNLVLSNTCQYSGSGDWTITNTQICENKEFEIDGTINIMDGGSLIIRNSEFIFNNSDDLCNLSYNKDDNCTVGLINRYGGLDINNSVINITNKDHYIKLYSRSTAEELTINNSIIETSSNLESRTDNTVIQNSELSSYDSKVIYLTLSDNSIIKNNEIYFNEPYLVNLTDDESRGSIVHIYDSDNLLVEENEVYSDSNKSFIGIAVSSSNIAEICDNTISSTPYEAGEGIYTSSSSDLTICDNIIEGTRNYDEDNMAGTGIKLSSSSGDILIENNIIQNSPYGIWMLRTSGETEVNDNLIYDSNYGLVFGTNATDISIYSTIFNNITNTDVYFGDDLGSNFIYNTNITNIQTSNNPRYISEYFINCSFDSSIIGISTTNRSFYFGWYLDVNVKDNESFPVKDAEVKFRNDENTTLFTEITDENGDIEQQIVYEYKINKTGIDYFTPLRYYATKYMFQPTYGTLNLTTNTILEITLSKLYDEEDYPTAATIIDEGEYTNKNTDLEFWFVNASDYASTLLGIPLKYNYSISPTGPWTQTEETHIILSNSFSDEDDVTLYVRTINPYGMYSNSQSDGIIVDLNSPSAPEINSPTHPDNTTWYADDSPIFIWNSTDSTSGVSGYSFVIDQDVGTLPDQIIDAQGTQLIAQSSSNGESIRIKDYENGDAYLFAQRIDTLTSFNTSALADGDQIKTTIYLFEEDAEVEEGINFTICLSDDFNDGSYTCVGDTTISDYDVKYPSGNDPDNSIRYSTTITLDSDTSTSELYLIIIGDNNDEPTKNISLSAREYDSSSELCDYDGSNCASSDKTIKFKLEKTQGEGNTITKEYSNLNDGIWYFHVRAVDIAGNWGPQTIYKLKINTIGAGAYITKPVSGAITYMNTTTVRGTLTSTADIDLYVNDSLIDSQTGVTDEFTFTDVELSMGSNKIYVIADNGTLEITSNIVYITRTTEPEYQLSITVGEEPTYESNHTIYRDDGGLVIGLATENPDDSTTDGGSYMRIISGEDNIAYLIISDPNKETQIQEKETFLNQQTFLDLIEPSFSGLKASTSSERLINLILTYEDVVLNANDDVMPAGRHTLIIKNNGYLSDGSVNVTIDVD